MSQHHYVYMLASKPRGAIYVGNTQNLRDVVEEHKANLVGGLTSLYAIHLLVFYERFEQSGPALLRTRLLKQLQRHEKIALIQQQNPDWRDLYEDLLQDLEHGEAAPV